MTYVIVFTIQGNDKVRHTTLCADSEEQARERFDLIGQPYDKIIRIVRDADFDRKCE